MLPLRALPGFRPGGRCGVPHFMPSALGQCLVDYMCMQSSSPTLVADELLKTPKRPAADSDADRSDPSPGEINNKKMQESVNFLKSMKEAGIFDSASAAELGKEAWVQYQAINKSILEDRRTLWMEKERAITKKVYATASAGSRVRRKQQTPLPRHPPVPLFEG